MKFHATTHHLKLNTTNDKNIKTRYSVSLPDQIKTSLTLKRTRPFPQASPGGPWTRSSSIPLVPIKSPQARFLNHHKSDFLKFNQALLTSRSFLVRKFLSCKLHDRKFLSCKLHHSRFLPCKLHYKKLLSCNLHDSRLLPCKLHDRKLLSCKFTIAYS